MNRRILSLLLSIVLCLSLLPWTVLADDTDFKALTIEKIGTYEDLVQSAKFVNAGNNYAGVTVKLTDNITMQAKICGDSSCDCDTGDCSCGHYICPSCWGKECGLDNCQCDGYYSCGYDKCDCLGEHVWMSNCNCESEPEYWMPIGTAEHPFNGTFDGGGYIITGLNIDTSKDSQGLFDYVDTNGVVKKLGVVEGHTNIGGIAGYNKDWWLTSIVPPRYQDLR